MVSEQFPVFPPQSAKMFTQSQARSWWGYGKKLKLKIYLSAKPLQYTKTLNEY